MNTATSIADAAMHFADDRLSRARRWSGRIVTAESYGAVKICRKLCLSSLSEAREQINAAIALLECDQ